ncbi:hypothetical protein OG949_40875 (plasmid) [Streptomyces scopuliridis]|uniref:hypothetical protein n=1 Tax=Streptomyces scopuliridis TaxID=452529 RepID=UPI002DDA6D61|nr:hypothetical protein [Streptomyces scopuliridis]WSB39102.1 hypothetical protein OG949_40875 [Streptomyces scopuliridis]
MSAAATPLWTRQDQKMTFSLRRRCGSASLAGSCCSNASSFSVLERVVGHYAADAESDDVSVLVGQRPSEVLVLLVQVVLRLCHQLPRHRFSPGFSG